jgi:CubicO group peptidase (beta-lactamase class C family)
MCAAPDTPIATPQGDRPISELAPGDLVYSVEAAGVVVVPILRVGSTPVVNHRVVRVELAGGTVLEVSAGHPTADGRTFADLLNGGQLGGTRLLGRKTVELMTANHIAHLADPHPFGFKWQGFGLGVRVVTDLGESPQLASVGTYGWDGAATTNVQIDPHERTVALLLCQHATFNEGDIIATFSNGYYSALDR